MSGHPGDDVVAQYLASAAWHERRGWWLEWYDEQFGGLPRCTCCFTTDDVDLLHVDFQNFRFEQVNEVVAVCGRCRALIAAELQSMEARMPGMPYFLAVQTAIGAVSRVVREE
ncbi:hypothetical protein ABIB25_000968 [Nakamurella sp. UYEF19]|uniref:hypothetical protein n=1 Tax=Nakamurella sp. UYEF19 TaxID=1756392 RepID=UPI0033914629